MKRSLLKSIFLIHLYSRFPGTADCISSMMMLRLSLGILSLILRRSFGVKTDQNMALQKCISFAFRFQNNLWYLNISTSLNCFIRSFSAFISYFLEASIRFLTLFFVCLFALFFSPTLVRCFAASTSTRSRWVTIIVWNMWHNKNTHLVAPYK